MKDRDLEDLMALCQLLAKETRSKTIELACRVIVNHCRGRRSRRHRTVRPPSSPYYGPLEARVTVVTEPDTESAVVGTWTPVNALPRTGP